MSFKINNKVALISGGASGLGLEYAKSLLRNGLRGVTLADVNPEFGKIALEELEDEFGKDKAIFVQTDVTNLKSFEGAFQETCKTFRNIDILINNAGIFNDNLWEKEISININGTIHGILLAFENYIPKYKSGANGVIVNISSVAGLNQSPTFPIYSATKSAVFGMTKAWGQNVHFDRTNVKVLAICPGITDTSMIFDIMDNKTLGEPYQKILNSVQDTLQSRSQTPLFVAGALVGIIENGNNGTVWVVEEGEAPYEFIAPPRINFAPKD